LVLRKGNGLLVNACGFKIFEVHVGFHWWVVLVWLVLLVWVVVWRNRQRWFV
jgi:hypothetical protein